MTLMLPQDRTRAWIALVLSLPLLAYGCSLTSTEKEQEAPYLSKSPFYTGKIEVVEAPSDNTFDENLVLDFEITYEQGKKGWPKTSYQNLEQVSINTVRPDWYPEAYYGKPKSRALNPDMEVEAVGGVEARVRNLEWMRLTDGATEKYRISFPTDALEGLPLEKEEGPLQLLVIFSLCGGHLSSNPSENDLKYRFNYCSEELVWVTPKTGEVRVQSLGNVGRPALSVAR